MRLITATSTFGLVLSGLLLAQASAPQEQPLSSLPSNPCELMTQAQLRTITGLDVTAVHRVPALDETVRAERERRAPHPGTICSFETASDFGAIMIWVPPFPERTAARYWEARSHYFQTYRGSAQQIAGLGADAWLAGGTSLHVLLRQDEYFTLSTQMYTPDSRELLTRIARAVLKRF